MQDLCVWKRYFLWCFIDFSVDWSKRRKNANFPRMIYLEMPLSVTRQPTNFLWNFHKKSRPRKCLLKHFICAFPLVFYGHFPIESKVSIGNIFWFCIFQETSYTPNPQKWKNFELNSKHLSKNIQICICSVQYSLRFPSFCYIRSYQLVIEHRFSLNENTHLHIQSRCRRHFAVDPFQKQAKKRFCVQFTVECVAQMHASMELVRILLTDWIRNLF